MKVGIMADTHDRLPFIDKAVRRLNEEKVDLVLHAGDYIAPFVVSHFKPLGAEMIGVFGNNDAELELLRRKFEEIDIQIRGRFAEIHLDGLRIAMLHGEMEELLKSLIETSHYDVIVHGHTHQVQTFREGKTLIINPGEVCGYLTKRATVALLNIETLEVRTITL